MEVDGKRLDDDIVSELCEPCQEGNVSTQADGYCIDCDEYMCKSCFQSHLKLKLCRNHVFEALDGGRKATQKLEDKCKDHVTEVIKYYCRNHDSVGCGDCLVAFHQKCETKFIRDLAKNIEESSDFKNILKEVDNLEDLKSEIEISLERNRNENAAFHDRALNRIQKGRNEMNAWLNNSTAQLEADEMEVWKENEILLSKLEDWTKIISVMTSKVRDEISTEKYKDENLFIRVIKCKSEISEFSSKNVPEIKSSLQIKSFTFEPNQSLFILTKSTNLGVIKVGGKNEDLQTSTQERQNDRRFIDGESKVASSKLHSGPEAEFVTTGERGTVNSSEDSVRAELEKELKQIWQTAFVEKETHERLQQSYNTLKKAFEDQVSLISREREQSIIATKDREQMIIRLQQKVKSLKSQLDSRIKENEILVSKSKARQKQDQNTNQSLQSKLKKISVSHEEERETGSSQIRDRQRQTGSAQKRYMYKLPDPRAAGFDVGKRVESTNPVTQGRTGSVTAVDPSGYVDVIWGVTCCRKAGVGGLYDVKLL